MWTENSSNQQSVIQQSTSETGSNGDFQHCLNSLEEEKAPAGVDNINAVKMTVVQPDNKSSDAMIDLAADDNGSDDVIIAPTTTDAPPTEAV